MLISTTAQIRGLLVEYQALVVALPEAESLSKKHDEAESWAKHAQNVLMHELSEDKTDIYEVYIQQILLADSLSSPTLSRLLQTGLYCNINQDGTCGTHSEFTKPYVRFVK